MLRQQLRPGRDPQLARSERAQAWHLYRRGSMPIRGQNPFGAEFFALAEEGVPEYPMEAVTPTRERPRGG